MTVARPSSGVLPGPGISERSVLPVSSRLANPKRQCGLTESTREVMFIKAHKNVERFYAFMPSSMKNLMT
jgi:hypothetical protein